MNYYLYRFINFDGEIIYIGKTKNLKTRAEQHFPSRSIKQINYDEVCKVEYAEVKTKADQHILEIYYINKTKPKYNISNKEKADITFSINYNLEWKEYDEFKIDKEVNLMQNDKINELELEILRLESQLKGQEEMKSYCWNCGEKLEWNDWEFKYECRNCNSKKRVVLDNIGFLTKQNKGLVIECNKIIKELEDAEREFVRYKRLKENE